MKNNKNNGFVKNSFIYILMIIVVITGFQFYLKGTSTQSQQISYSKLIKHLKAGDIKSLSYQPSGSIIEVKGKYEKAQKFLLTQVSLFRGRCVSPSDRVFVFGSPK